MARRQTRLPLSFIAALAVLTLIPADAAWAARRGETILSGVPLECYLRGDGDNTQLYIQNSTGATLGTGRKLHWKTSSGEAGSVTLTKPLLVWRDHGPIFIGASKSCTAVTGPAPLVKGQ